MANPDSGVTIHMAASLDGFIARKDGRVDWLETSDEFTGGDTNERLRPALRHIWVAGGGMLAAECLRLGLADEVRCSILPIVIGKGLRFFEKLDRDVALHLAEVKACKNGMAALRYEVRRSLTPTACAS